MVEKIILKIFIMLLTGVNILSANAQQARVSSNDTLPAALSAGKNQNGLKKIETMSVLPLFGAVSADRYTNQAKAVPPNLIIQNWGFFCRKEWQFEKRTRVPLRFRVGQGLANY